MVRLALIGRRGHAWSAVMLAQRLPSVRIAAVSPGGVEDDMDDLLAALPQPPERVTSGWEEALATPDLQGVLVFGPLHRHAGIAAAAIAHGLPVLCEKPVAAEVAGLADLTAACERHQGRLCAMMAMRDLPWVQAARACVQGGGMGRVRLVTVRKSYRLRQRPAWFADRRQSTGLIPWVGSHALDLAEWAGGLRLRQIQALVDHPPAEGPPGPERCAVLSGRCRGGALFQSTCDLWRPDACPRHDDDHLRIVGEQGQIDAGPGGVILTDASGHSRPLDLPPAGDLLHEAIQAMASGGFLPLDTATSLRLARLALAGRDSADAGGKPMEIPG